MAVISIPDTKKIESKELEVHVVMCEYRRQVLEAKIADLERDINGLGQKVTAGRKLFLSSIISVITGVITTLFSVFLNYNIFRP